MTTSRRLLAAAALVIVAAVAGAFVAASGDAGMAIVLAAVGLGVGLNLLVSLLLLSQLRHLGGEVAALRRGAGRQRRMTRRVQQELRRAHERLARHRKVLDRTEERVRGVRVQQNQDYYRRVAEGRVLRGQLQETVRLFATYPMSAQVPPMGHWAASPDLVGALLDEFLDKRPGLVVECGSGVSTLWLATAARQHGVPTRIVALEHDAEYAQESRALLARHGLSDIAEVRDAPLQVVDVEGTDRTWYAPSAVEDLHDIGLLFVDGPPTSTGEHARYPALPVLQDQLAPTCSIVLDDMIREDEQQVAQLWHDRLPDLSRTDLRLEKGATIFRRG
ncbi:MULTISPECIES: class I SAM-dependent methyltransferase [unclassified Nocardioides]|uniref:class I SAM-dependent methyltransferase n=1 Tax=unclassified Nocardioides TaxID=2615069 RepID=UPI000702B026|nr:MULTISPECIES: class I SAM-dependent methyltransferase [unclassified Nocardioides]KRC54016.1 hypothetical protein ASE19_08045 [Nocardioides sp. Root79]KRC71352.1 hypothetical protein ASE20_10460 [Nocardioides sp. Root240]